ncbi:phenylalanine--tRNA ligase beta subunit-related protein [Sorangium sp. So ce1182]|uniref:phenylalanine--tRNA ligase beta subunit-related protein n=1 Tax=Sorangium sp. So ce1182 TaxID=3133334 RepID=UPI003F5DD955
MTRRWSAIAISPAVAASLPGVEVLGGTVLLSPRARTRPISEGDWRALHDRWRGTAKAALGDVHEIACYRAFYRLLGLDPGKTPPSVEGLICRFLLKPELTRFPVIHPIVDAVNVAAVASLVPLGVFDAERLQGAVTLARADGGEPFQGIGAPTPEPLSAGALILRDDEKVLSRFCYRDAEAQKVTASTAAAMLLGCVVPGMTAATVGAALDRALDELTRVHDVRGTS